MVDANRCQRRLAQGGCLVSTGFCLADAGLAEALVIEAAAISVEIELGPVAELAHGSG